MGQPLSLRTLKRSVVALHVCRLLGRPEASLDFRCSFVALGGHSLLAIQLASACKRSGVKIAVTSILLSESIDEIIVSATFCDPVPTTTTSGKSTPTSNLCCPRLPNSTDSEMSFVSTNLSGSHLTEMQMSFIHSYKSRPGSNIINFYETYRTLDIPAMRTAWKIIVETEPIFRYSFNSIDSLQVNNNPFRWTETVVDSVEALDAELLKDLAPQDPECSFEVLTLPQVGMSTIVWRVHHAFVDGISSQMLYRKLRNVLKGLPISAGTPFVRVAEELRRHQDTSSQANRVFWNQQRQQHPQPATEIGLPRPVSNCWSGIENITFTIPIDKLATRAREVGVSLASWYQAAWALVLSVYSDSDSVVFGSVLSGRDLPIAGVEDTIGPLINTFPFNVSLDRNATTTEFLRSVFSHSVRLSSFQSSVPDDGYSRNFESAVAMELEMHPFDDQSVQPIGPSWFRTVPDVPLSVYMNLGGTLRICFKPERYDKADMNVLAETYRRAILELLSPTRTVKQCSLSLISPDAKSCSMRFGNCLSDNTSPSSIKEDLVTLHEGIARAYPTAVALRKGEKCLTYAEFDRLASCLAYHLRELVQPGEVVCVHADRSINWIIAIYGILKAGAVYSAQDAALPPFIRNTNFETAKARLFLTPAIAQKELKPESCSLCLSVEELFSNSNDWLLPHRGSATPEDNAYLCFTSGSTGKPKGVLCHHAGLVAFQKSLEVRLFAAPGQRVSQLMSPAFDGSIHEIFSALTYGATLVLADNDSDNLFSQLQHSTTAILTPSIAKILDPNDFPELQTVYLVGEPVPQHVCDVWSGAKALYNMYGPTEATCGATIQRLRPNTRVNVGPPNPTTRIYILDRNQQLSPPGVIGEIYLAGVQVARGYIGRPDYNIERFLPDTICNRPGEMMYRTGDRGYFNHLGEVECLGRYDRQVKLRGFRLDMNDLEVRIARAVPEATAVAICPNEDCLVMMIQPETLIVAKVQSRIVNVLPVHAVPRHITAVSQFPMTPGGKIDYKEIARQCVPVTQTTDVIPCSVSETSLAQIWREVLGLSADIAIHRDSNFIALGGHSIMQLRLASKLSRHYGVNVPLSSIVRSSNLAELARYLAAIPTKESSQVSHRSESLGRFHLSPIEQDWFEKYSLNTGSSAFNVTYACSIDSTKVNLDHLIASWNAVLARHSIFRSRYCLNKKSKRTRRAYAKLPPQATYVRSFDLWREVNRSFHLHRQPPIRVITSKNLMLVSMSHIIADLTTMQILLKEVTRMYNGQGLPPVVHSYANTTQWSSPAAPTQKAWWADYLDGAGTRESSIPWMNLHNRSNFGGESRFLKLGPNLASKVFSFSETQNTTLHQLGLGAVALALQPEHRETDIILGGPYLNRQHEDLETVGLFLEPIPIHIRTPTFDDDATDPSPTSPSFISHVQFCSQQALAHAMPWHQILAAVRESSLPSASSLAAANPPPPKNTIPAHPLLDVMVTFHDQRQSSSASLARSLAVPGLEPLLTYGSGSKFALLVEFCAMPTGIVLRLEYDTQCIPRERIGYVAQSIVAALRGIVEGRGEGEIKGLVREELGRAGNASVEKEEEKVEEGEEGGGSDGVFSLGKGEKEKERRWFGRKMAEL